VIELTIYSIDEKKPKISESAYVHPQACVIGDVEIGERVFIAPMVSIRGDRGPIKIGDETNLQDGVTVHSDPRFTTVIGERVNIGHNATIHSELIEDYAAIGMGAVLMLGSRVAKGVLIANAALLHNGTVTEPYKVYAGVPAKFMRDIKLEDPARKAIDVYLDSYVENVNRYKSSLKQID
jgi:carbonic anhydrase/acetyltransferase-like protein (isoleucine patch superfamily)